MKAVLRIPVRDPERVLKALEADNMNWVQASYEDGEIVLMVEGKPGEVRNALNDLIVCVQTILDVRECLSEGHE